MIRLENHKQPTRRAGGWLGFEVLVTFRDETRGSSLNVRNNYTQQ